MPAVYCDIEAAGITQKGLDRLKKALDLYRGDQLLVLEVPVDKEAHLVGFLLVSKTRNIAHWTGCGFRTDKCGEGGRGYSQALLELRAEGIVPFRWKALSMSPGAYSQQELESHLRRYVTEENLLHSGEWKDLFQIPSRKALDEEDDYQLYMLLGSLARLSDKLDRGGDREELQKDYDDLEYVLKREVDIHNLKNVLYNVLAKHKRHKDALQKNKVYVFLYNGMKDVDNPPDDCGFDGPVLGPFDLVQITYGEHVKLYDISGNQGLITELVYRDGMIIYGDEYYGDISVYSDNLPL